MTEKQAQLACLVVGGLLLLESVATLFIALFAGIIGTLVGGLAIGVGAGSATNEQFAKGIAVIVLTLAAPFVVAAVLSIEGLLLLIRRRGKVIIAAALVAITAQIAFHPIFEQRFHAADLVLCAVQLAAIALALPFARTRAA
jgi:hypothetical protein